MMTNDFTGYGYHLDVSLVDESPWESWNIKQTELQNIQFLLELHFLLTMHTTQYHWHFSNILIWHRLERLHRFHCSWFKKVSYSYLCQGVSRGKCLFFPAPCFPANMKDDNDKSTDQIQNTNLMFPYQYEVFTIVAALPLWKTYISIKAATDFTVHARVATLYIYFNLWLGMLMSQWKLYYMRFVNSNICEGKIPRNVKCSKHISCVCLFNET